MKTIEEIAVIEAANYDNPFDEPAYDKKFYDGFLAGAKYLMEQPPAARLTAEERKMIKGIMERFYNTWLQKKDECNEYAYNLIKGTLESIFGKEMFEKGGEGNG